MNYRANEENAIRTMKALMKTEVTVDSAVLDIWEMFQDIATEEGGDDALADYPTQMFTLAMATRLTNQDIKDFDQDSDMLINYIRLRSEVLSEVI
jgi:hypothetical protein